MTTEELLTFLRPPDWHWIEDGVTECFFWGVTQEPEAIARVAISTTSGGRFPFTLETDIGVHTRDPRQIEAFVRDPEWRKRYGIDKQSLTTKAPRRK